jgi:prepilin-type N-terminal cleavage/methylation domain-containing protein
MEAKMRKSQKSSQQGFTLVELSIVLVIIGLIISSVLVGQDLIRSAELRATITQYEGYNAALATFKGKYGGLPGDVRGFTDFGFGADATNSDGNNSGTLAGSTALTGENVFFWNHLGTTGAGLISGSYVGTSTGPTSTTLNTFTPTSKAGGNWGVYSVAGINYFIIGVAGSGVAGTYLTSDTFTPLDARSMDEKVDDGKPGKGLVMAKDGHASDADTAPDAAGADACVTAAGVTGAYATSITIVSCTIRLRQQI